MPGTHPFKLPETLTHATIAEVCQRLPFNRITSETRCRLDGSQFSRIDGAGIAFLYLLQTRITAAGGSCEFINFPESVTAQLAAYAQAKHAHAENSPSAKPRENPITQLGKSTVTTVISIGNTLVYLGEIIWTLCTLFRGRFRKGDALLAFLRCGVQAVPVVMLIGFLLGLILAFQSAIPLKMFGGEGFVGGLVGIALVRELGLILTAILVAGRTGSAFAAELGTMKVNEEIDALETMGIRPIRFLVAPRLLAGTLALPILSLFATLAGLVGGWLVMTVLGFSTQYYIDQLQAFVHAGDLIGSICKAFIFGFMISAVGCRFGLTAGQDAGAVGTATTASVVTSIVLLTVLEGLFAVLFFAMGW